jgi:hypothetical protein
MALHLSNEEGSCFTLVFDNYLYMTMGDAIRYTTGTESLIIPVDFSNFTPGIYTDPDIIDYLSSYFAGGFTETLIINPVPEPTTLALAGLGGLSLLLFRRRK